MPRVELGRPATYEDLVNVPEHLVAEIVDGELWASPRPAPKHAWAYSSLAAIIVAPFSHGRDGPGGWRIVAEPELHLGHDVLVPDVAGWRRERMPRLPETAFFPLAPDWICEIVSPSTVRLDRTKKLRVYGREGVRHAWIVDPLACTLEVLRLENDRWVKLATHGGTDRLRAEPFGALDLELPLLWDEPLSAER
jgi:Uma2 family endonuclease